MMIQQMFLPTPNWNAFLPLVLLCFPALGSTAEEPSGGPEPGHSQHGDVFDDGPRQAAVLMSGMPKLVFPITTSKPDTQTFFLQGLGQLHGFWYYEAERSFRQAAVFDPGCAMTYWGMAMANINNEIRAKKFTAKAVELKSQASPRERLWIQVLENFYKDDKRDKKAKEAGYIKDLEAIGLEFPDDIEAQAFLAWRLYYGRIEAPSPTHLATNALIDKVLAANPMHPAHHYRIHLWDAPKPAKALPSAALCGQSAPGIAHMWHMPGHIYSKLKRWEDAVWQQEAATRVDHAYMIRSLVMPDQIHNYAHNEEWLIRNWNELGRARDGIDLAKSLIENPRHPKLNTLDKSGNSASYGRTRLLDTLLEWELWDELDRLASGSPWLEKGLPQTSHEVARLRALAVAHAMTYQLAGLTGDETDLKKIVTQEKEKVSQAQKDKSAKTGTGQAAAKSGKEAGKKQEPVKPGMTDAEKALKEAEFLKLLLQPDKGPAMAAMAAAASNIPKERTVRYWLRLGKVDSAVTMLPQLTQDLSGNLLRIEVLLAAGKKEEAKTLFERQREAAAQIDADLPAARRMEEWAKLFNTAGDWRKPRPAAKDTGDRPDLATLGPVRWHSPEGRPWHGVGLDGAPLSDVAYQGKNTVLLFYLGHQCGHCMEQLGVFAKKAAEFENAGLNIVAISTDPPNELGEALSASPTPGKMPFPLLSDQARVSFKTYRCHDDFEDLPLHGLVLLDARGKLRWIDISYEPFMDADFALKEFQRLLQFDPVMDPKMALPVSAGIP